MDGVISAPIAIAGLFLIPDLPENSRAFYLRKDQIVLARKRMESIGRAPRTKLGWSAWKRIFGRWHVYLLTILYIIFINTVSDIPNLEGRNHAVLTSYRRDHHPASILSRSGSRSLATRSSSSTSFPQHSRPCKRWQLWSLPFSRITGDNEQHGCPSQHSSVCCTRSSSPSGQFLLA